MYLLLPPSETKRVGGTGAPLAVDRLPFPALLAVRTDLVDSLIALTRNPETTRSALGITTGGLDAAIAANSTLRTAPTLPALDRYDGVLYTALHLPALGRAERSRADARVLITSALFGMVTAAAAIPGYRLSAGSRPPGLTAIAALWRPLLTELVAGLDGPVIDLRSGAYAAFGKAPDAIAVRVVRPGTAGTLLAVSHDNKATKGRFARLLATCRAEPADLTAVLRLASRAGWTVRQTGERSIDLYC